MGALVPEKEKTLTLKELQSHVIKTIVGALAVAVIGSFITIYSFYYSTINTIDNLKESKTETQSEIKELRISVDKINDNVNEIQTKLSNTNIYTDNNKEQIKSLNERMGNMEKKQDEMLNILYDIKSRRK